ncbi:unnamed protein product [Angiostrongylus costaricensis]|uniref:Uncharacterized protein n=1 Tax=Angiostrongylus costaricensis TaxID=334426 RepID=A0A0R3PR63_ANGCS|nr:unnamed protein product [Angiostrongylus costaricensis]
MVDDRRRLGRKRQPAAINKFMLLMKENEGLQPLERLAVSSPSSGRRIKISPLSGDCGSGDAKCSKASGLDEDEPESEILAL